MFNLSAIFARPRRTPFSPFQRAVHALDRGEFGAAFALFDELLALPDLSAVDRAAVVNKRGVACARTGRREEALEAFMLALECDPHHAPALVNIGNLLFEDGAIDDAIVHYEAAIRLDDRYGVAHLNLGVAYKKLGRLGDAVREMRRSGRLEGRVLPRLNRER